MDKNECGKYIRVDGCDLLGLRWMAQWMGWESCNSEGVMLKQFGG